MRSRLSPLIAAAAVAASIYPAAAYQAFVTDLANLRTGPGLGFSAMLAIPATAPVNVLGCGPSWCQVQYSGAIGFVAAPLLVAGVAPPVATTAGMGGPFDLLTAPLDVVGGVVGGTTASGPAAPPTNAPVMAGY